MANLEVIGLTKKMLREALDTNLYWKESPALMPKSKASWLVANSRINDEDYCGVIGYEDQKMISFVFMFPDLLNIGDSKGQKVYWMLAWWVHSKYKNTVLSTYIYNEAVNLADKQILIKSYAENVTTFYEKQPFTVIASRLRHTIFLSLDTSILLGRFKFLKTFKFAINWFDAMSYSLLKGINKLKFKKQTKDISYDYIDQIDAETWSFIEPLCKNDLILKTKEYINWQINNNQYLQTPVSDKQSYKALQTGISNNIHIHNVKILKDHKIIGFISYIINYNELNIKYFLVKDEKYYELCIDALMDNFYKLKVRFIFTDDTKVSDTIAKRYKTIFRHRVLKKGLAHNETKLDFSTANMMNRDGHFY